MIKINTSELTGFLKSFPKKLGQKFPSKEMMQEVGEYVVSYSKERTNKGLDVNLRPFAPYSSRTKGRRGKVDLSESGGMLNDMRVKSASKDKVTVGFGSTKYERIAAAHQSGRGVPKREFFGIGASDKKARAKIDEIVQRHLTKAIKEAVG